MFRPTSTTSIGRIRTTSAGLGQDTPFLTGSNSDSLIGLDPPTKKWTYFRIPYPLGFYARGMDGRIDDAMPDGRAVRCTPTTARTSSGTSKAEKEPRARS